jgi:fructose-1,6-bisphosphatase/inositol monophosphatase family enzyme
MPIDTADLGRLHAILVEAADTEILPRFKRLDADDIAEKTGPQDLVTVADQAAERLIAARVHALWPDAVFIGEESTAADPSLLDGIAAAPRAVVVDPIDGTFNFANGLPLFGVMAAVVEAGETVAGLIYDPVSRDLAYALKGEGAWVLRSDGVRVPLKVAAPVPVAEMHGSHGWYYLHEPERSRSLANLTRISATYSYRCAAHEYRLVASGGCHFLTYGKLMPWDHAPGVLIHAEAGGYAALLHGERPYSPVPHDNVLILAPDRASWQVLADTLFRS